MFKDIVGQEDVKKRLISSAGSGKVAHAQLLCGPEGVGKLSLAIAYAQYLNCQNPGETDSCGVCPSCVKYEKLAHPDLHFVFPIVQKKQPRKEVCDDYMGEWREMLGRSPYFNLSQWLAHIGAENSQGLIYSKESNEIIRKLSLKVYEAKYKVMIIWLPERMNDECSNKLLKILEEPMGTTVFLLVSNVPDNVIATIQSRAQRINVHAVAQEAIVGNLTTQYNIDSDEAQNIAHISKGSWLKAMQHIRLNEEYKFFLDLFIGMMRASYARNIKEIKNIADKISTIGRERQKSFLSYAQNMVREYFVSNLKQDEIVYLTREESDFGVRFAPFINERNIIGFMDELALAERHIEQNVNAKMVFFDLCLKNTMLLKM